jgi:enoyl-CoA hydratase/carnithine racemase
MLVTGDFIDAPSALTLGLVNRVVAAESLDAEVERLAASIVAKPAGAVEMGKRLFYRQVEEDLEAAYAQAAEVMACNIMTEEAGEGIDAFLEKRPPRWVRP